jgi:hypothetical protein
MMKNIGLARCMMYNESDPYRFLQIRTEAASYHPLPGKYMIGTWTFTEIVHALKNGYKMLDCEWAISMPDAYNPFTKVFKRLYELKKNAKDEETRWFYKSMMNNALGKFGQTRSGQEIVIDSVEEAEKYLARNYEIMRGVDMNFMYRKKDSYGKLKPYYSPFIPTLVNANARVFMHKQMMKIPVDHVYYTDTDSIISADGYLDKFSIGDEMGEFKVVEKEAPLIIYSRKFYSIGEQVKAAGVHKKDITLDRFKAGKLKNKRMMTLLSTTDLEKVGTFVDQEIDLHAVEEMHRKTESVLEKIDIYIDSDIGSVSYFADTINKVEK